MNESIPTHHVLPGGGFIATYLDENGEPWSAPVIAWYVNAVDVPDELGRLDQCEPSVFARPITHDINGYAEPENDIAVWHPDRHITPPDHILEYLTREREQRNKEIKATVQAMKAAQRAEERR